MKLMQIFEERLLEIDAYIDLLVALERQVQSGKPTVGGAPITSQQQKILYSCVYLQIYNLVEATATWCVDAVANAVVEESAWRPGDLLDKLRREWVKSIARTSYSLNADNRLKETVEFCDLLLRDLPIAAWQVEKGGGGNWDCREIESIAERLGCDLQITRAAELAVKKRLRDDMGAMSLVKEFRNRLAHGAISFEDCGSGITVGDLRDVRDRTVGYLREVVAGFDMYIDNLQFLAPDRRPYVGAFI